MNNRTALVGSKILGIGTDIVHLPRFQRLLNQYPLQNDGGKKQSFIKIARKYMHPYELNSIQEIANEPNSTSKLILYAAGIWGVKESILKALSCFVPAKDMPPAQFIYTKLIFKSNTAQGRPILQFDNSKRTSLIGKEADFYRRYIEAPSTRPLVSVSHDGEYLVTFTCLLEG